VEIQITLMQPADRPVVGRILGQAMAPSPLNSAALGQSVRRNEVLFGTLISVREDIFVAKDAGEIVGVMAWAEWPDCQIPMKRMLPLLPKIVRGVGLGSTMRLFKWMPRWAKHDPSEPHVHFGPFGVNPERQRQGIGSTMLAHFCEHVDGSKAAAYLETDTESNVALYRRFGWEVTAEEKVLGVPNWFMWRPPAAT
jgi:ribosomal protein S18 acetylase RimI-like enzyme